MVDNTKLIAFSLSDFKANSNQFSNNLTYLIEDKALRFSMEKVGQKKSSEFSYNKLIENTNSLYSL